MFNFQYLTGNAYAQAEDPLLNPLNDSESPVFHLPGFTAEIVVDGLVNHGGPTSMAFLGPDDFLVLEKDEGTVLRVINGLVQKEPVLDVNVANTVEQCMCGIAVSKSNSAANETGSKTYVFIYFTESDEDGGASIANRLYRYEFLDNKLVNPKLLLDLPGLPGPRHNGGAVKIGPDNNVFATIGDLEKSDGTTTKAQNNPKNSADATGGILRVSQDGKPVKDPTNDTYLFGNTFPLNLYYAYGVRNSFGIDFDPVTGNLWDTENGPAYGDELNLVKPGFNSGWNQVMGIWVFGEGDPREGTGTIASDQPTSLVELGGGIGSYQPPKFTWLHTIGPTAIQFLDSDVYGIEFENDLFVGDIHNGIVYHFDLNKERTQLVLSDPLADRIANTTEEALSGGIVLATGFGGITDIEVNPYDGYMYVVSLGQGKIFKIIPSK
jgi:aldose sugar dehydrogenase